MGTGVTEPRPRALLLDLDGTLADSLPAMRAAYERFLAEHGRRGSDQEFDRLNGPSLPEIVAILRAAHVLADPEAALLARYRTLVAEHYVRDAGVQRGAGVLLSCARRLGLSILVVTSAERSFADGFLARHSLGDAVDGVVTPEGLARSKPDPAIYLRALERLGLRASDAWAVEDSPNGLAAAEAAGIRCFVLAPSTRAAFARPEQIISALATLVAHLECDLEPLAPGLRVLADGEPMRYEPAIEARVDARWAQTLSERPDRHDGSMLTLVGREPDALRARFVGYRHYLAQRAEPALGLGIVPLAVSGLLVCEGQVALARRADHTTQYPGWLELVPSGGIDATRLRADGSVDWEAQLLVELEEETGLAAHAVTRIVPLSLVRDRVDAVVDLAARIEIAPAARATAKTGDEYEALRWLDAAALRALLDEEERLVPASRAICEAYLRSAVPE